MAAEPWLGALDPSWGPRHINPEGPWLIEGPNIKWILEQTSRVGPLVATKLVHLNNVCSKTITLFNTRHSFAE